jgi:hypothetical protein
MRAISTMAKRKVKNEEIMRVACQDLRVSQAEDAILKN